MHEQQHTNGASVICATGTAATNGATAAGGGGGSVGGSGDYFQAPIDECFNGNFLANPDAAGTGSNDTLSTTNGRRSPPNEFLATTTVVPLGQFDQDIVRIIGQHLVAIGLNRSADLLMAESGTRLDHPLAAQFRRNVLDGNWTKAGQDLELLKPYLLTNTDEDSIGVKGVGTGCFRIDTSAITNPPSSTSSSSSSTSSSGSLATTNGGTNGNCRSGSNGGITVASNGDSNGNGYALCSNGNGHFDTDEMECGECSNPKGLLQMKFLILEQKYLECLEDNRLYEALHVLRTELTPLHLDTQRVHLLSSYIMCSHRSELLKRAKWDGKGLVSRTKLIDKLQKFLPPNMMLPPRRLLTILEQSLSKQVRDCLYHNLKTDVTIYDESLLCDHVCPKEAFPNVCMQVLNNDHLDEIWFCQFSPDGSKLATGSKDTNVIVWDVNPETCTISVRRTLDGHTTGAAVVSWSPDSIHLLVCGQDEAQEVWLWNTDTDKIVKISQSSDDQLTTCSWNKEGTKFVVGGIRGHFYHCDLDGNITDSWEGVRVTWMHYKRHEPKNVLAADTHFRIRSYNFDELSESLLTIELLVYGGRDECPICYRVVFPNSAKEAHSILTFTLDKKEKYAAVNVMSQGIHLYDVSCRTLVRKLRGLTQNTFRIHSSFGGRNDEFLASGSEDNKVYIWNIKRETPIAVLAGHTRTVNCVHWNPVHAHMLVSVSDDATIRVWGPAKLAEAKRHNDKYFASKPNDNSTSTNGSATNSSNSLGSASSSGGDGEDDDDEDVDDIGDGNDNNDDVADDEMIS